MINIVSCINFNCIPPTGNLIFIAILNALGISLNSYKVYRDKYIKKIAATIPILPTINIIIESISLGLSILVFFIKHCMNQKSINMLIKSIGKILRIILIVVSIVNIFILEKDLVNFDDNSFLNDKMPYGRDSDDYTNIDRVNNLKKFKDIPLELYQNEGIEYFKRFFQIRIIYDIDTILGENM